MGRKKSKSRKGGVAIEKEERLPEPDADSSAFYMDEIDEFSENKNKILLEGGTDYTGRHGRRRKGKGAETDSESEEEEVMALSDWSDQEEAELEAKLRRAEALSKTASAGIDSDDEDEKIGAEDKGQLSNMKAWGKNRNRFYGADDDVEDGSEDDGEGLGAEDLEEREAVAIQKKLAEELEEADFGLDQYYRAKPEEENERDNSPEPTELPSSSTVERVLNKKEKLLLLQRQSPEFFPLLEEYDLHLQRYANAVKPMEKLIAEGRVKSDTVGARFIQMQSCLVMNYCITLCSYFMLRSRGKPLVDHPVYKRLQQFRMLMSQTESKHGDVYNEIKEILVEHASGESRCFQERPSTIVKGGRVEESTQGLPAASDEEHSSLVEDNHAKKKRSTRTQQASSSSAQSRRIRSPDVEPATANLEQSHGQPPAEETDNTQSRKQHLLSLLTRFNPSMDGSSESSESEQEPENDSELTRERNEGLEEDEKEDLYETLDEKEALAFYGMMKGAASGPVPAGGGGGGEPPSTSAQLEPDADELMEEEEEDGKRSITYQIKKNKGLTPYRKKENRNPRVKHRNKFRKATIKRKGKIREPRNEMTKYSGEMSGIRAGIKRGIKLKA